MDNNLNFVSDELLAAYLDGNTTPEENDMIQSIMAQDPELFDVFSIASDASGFDSLFPVFQSEFGDEQISDLFENDTVVVINDPDDVVVAADDPNVLLVHDVPEIADDEIGHAAASDQEIEDMPSDYHDIIIPADDLHDSDVM